MIKSVKIVRWFLVETMAHDYRAGSHASSSKLAMLIKGFLATVIGRAMLEALRALMLEI